jgi:hypothetical protein
MKPGITANTIQNFCPYLKQNMLHFLHWEPFDNGVYRNNYCYLCELWKTRDTLQNFLMLWQVANTASVAQHFEDLSNKYAWNSADVKGFLLQ